MVRFVTFLLLAASATLPFAFAHNTGGGNDNNGGGKGNNSCNSGEFFFSKKSCCLPRGGQQNPPSPPKGTTCPPSGWSWHSGKGCCVPHQPPEDNPPPQCSNGWKWDDGDLKCCPNSPTPPTPPPSTPSNQPGQGNHGGHRRRALKSRSTPLCPQGLEACPIPDLMNTTGDNSDNIECLDTYSELESCGGCASTGVGQDCSAILGVWNVGCQRGSCVVTSCQAGYKVSRDKKSCIAL